MELWFAVAVITLPLASYLWNLRQEQLRAAAWRRASLRTKLQLTGKGGARSLFGRWKGSAIEVHQGMVARYKQSPLFPLTLRAQLPAAGAVRADARRTDAFASASVTESGWLEYVVERELDLDHIEPLLDELVDAAHAAASERQAR